MYRWEFDKGPQPGENYAVGHANFVVAYTTDSLAHVIYPGGPTLHSGEAIYVWRV